MTMTSQIAGSDSIVRHRGQVFHTRLEQAPSPASFCPALIKRTLNPIGNASHPHPQGDVTRGKILPFGAAIRGDKGTELYGAP